MSKRAVVNVSTNEYYARGQARLQAGLDQFGAGCDFLSLGKLPVESPSHKETPFAFKYHALWPWRDKYDTLIWADCSILPARSLEPVWRHIEAHGAMIMHGGFTNYEWTADSAYPDLFPRIWTDQYRSSECVWADMRALNRFIKHVIGGFFGLSMKHPVGRKILEEMYALAQTKAFVGPVRNTKFVSDPPQQFHGRDLLNGSAKDCGPHDVRGHRHDQSALSVVAWRNSVDLVLPPTFLVYGKAECATDERTVVVADGGYE